MSLLERLGSFFSPKKLSPEEKQSRQEVKKEQEAQKGKSPAEIAKERYTQMGPIESTRQASSNKDQEVKENTSPQNQENQAV